MSKHKRRLALACPCCGGDVTHRRYGFNVLRPPRFSTFYVCASCERALTGDDDDARHAAQIAFLDYLEGLLRAPAAQ
jgi:hypothetical protein